MVIAIAIVVVAGVISATWVVLRSFALVWRSPISLIPPFSMLTKEGLVLICAESSFFIFFYHHNAFIVLESVNKLFEARYGGLASIAVLKLVYLGPKTLAI